MPRASSLALEAFEELAMHYELHRRDPQSALEFTLAALERLNGEEPQGRTAGPFASPEVSSGKMNR